MAFAGRWETETQEGYDAFCKVLGENAGSNFPLPLLLNSIVFCTSLAFFDLASSSRPTIGIPDDVIERGRDYKLITEVTQDDKDFTWTLLYPANAKVTNKFTIGKEGDMETIGGKKFKVGRK